MFWNLVGLVRGAAKVQTDWSRALQRCKLTGQGFGTLGAKPPGSEGPGPLTSSCLGPVTSSCRSLLHAMVGGEPHWKKHCQEKKSLKINTQRYPDYVPKCPARSTLHFKRNPPVGPKARLHITFGLEGPGLHFLRPGPQGVNKTNPKPSNLNQTDTDMGT